MSKFSIYNVELKNLGQGAHTFEYLLENTFFTDIDGDEVRKGKVKVSLTLKRMSALFELDFHLLGTVKVPCDRCLDDIDIPVDVHNRLVVKFGKEYAEENDEVVVIPEDEGAINIAWFLYEFVVLAIPMKHVHLPGQCNKTMSSKLRKHIARPAGNGEEGDEDGELSADDDLFSADEAEEMEKNIDPRWDALKGLMDNEDDSIE